MKSILSAMKSLGVLLRRISDINECQIDLNLEKIAKLQLVFIPEKVRVLLVFMAKPILLFDSQY